MMRGEQLLLSQDLPSTVLINGLAYPVHFGFKTGIQLDLAYHDEKYTLEERYVHMLHLFYLEIPEDIGSALNQMLWFFTCGRYNPEVEKKRAEQENTEQQKSRKKEPRQFCFSQDAELILSAFYSEYGIMLNRLQDEDLHWWEFMALFSSLPESTTIKRYIEIRTCSLNGLPEAERKRIRKLRSRIRIQREIKDADLSPAMRLQKRNERWLEYARKRSYEAGKT